MSVVCVDGTCAEGYHKKWSGDPCTYNKNHGGSSKNKHLPFSLAFLVISRSGVDGVIVKRQQRNYGVIKTPTLYPVTLL